MPLGLSGLTIEPSGPTCGIFFLATWWTSWRSCLLHTRRRKSSVKKWMHRLAAQYVSESSALRSSAADGVISEYSTT